MNTASSFFLVHCNAVGLFRYLPLSTFSGQQLPSSLPVVAFTAPSCQELKGREETQVLVPNVLTKECLQLLEKEGLQAIPESWSLPRGVYFTADDTQ